MGKRCEQGLHSRYTAVGDRPAWGPAGGRQGVPDEGHRLMSTCVPMDSTAKLPSGQVGERTMGAAQWLGRTQVNALSTRKFQVIPRFLLTRDLLTGNVRARCQKDKRRLVELGPQAGHVAPDQQDPLRSPPAQSSRSQKKQVSFWQ